MSSALLADVEARLRDVELAANEAWWELAVHADDETAARRGETDRVLSDALADPDVFTAVSSARADRRPDPLVSRGLDEIYRVMLPHQVPADLRHRIVELQVAVESDYAVHRASVRGEELDDNAVLDILRGADDPVLRRDAWIASKDVGALVAERVCELARLRNEAARALGFRDYFSLALATSDLNEQRLLDTLTDVDRVTTRPFAAWKGALDRGITERFGVHATDLRPWHYDDPFFQDLPVAACPDLDPVFAAADLTALTRRSFDGLGLDVEPILARSDLYPRPAKNQHAFCIDIDREGDVRVLCNLRPNARWAETMLHELGHGAYFAEVDGALPWSLRTMHSLTTEAVAMLLGRLARTPVWLQQVAGLPAGEGEALAADLDTARAAQLLLFARWTLVMTNFERGLYAEPDADHDARWWDLVERYQGVRRPDGRAAPDWAAKIHVAVAPVYYQNYLYGEMLASQLADTIERECGGLVDRPEAGRFLRDRMFRPGATRRWDHLVEEATGEPLSPRHLAAQAVNAVASGP